MTIKFALLLFFVSFVLSSCSYEYYNKLFYDQEINGIKITGQVTEITIIDNRLPNSNKNIEIPKFQLFSYEAIANPALTEDNKQTLERKVRSYFTNTGKSIKVKVYIANTVKKVKKGFFHFREFALIEMSIAIYNENDKLLDFGTATSYFEHKPSGNVKYEIELAFEKVIRDAVYQCFNNFNRIQKTVTVGRAFRYGVIKKED